MFRLPVSGLRVAFQQPTGWEDVLLQETRYSRVALSLLLIERLAQPADAGAVDWKELTVTDLDTLLLRLRQYVMGDVILSDTRCDKPACGARMDISFRIGEYLASGGYRAPQRVEKKGETGWFCLAGEAAKFRLPTGSDLAAVESSPNVENELMRHCTEPAGIPARLRRRMARAMESMAPSLSRIIEGPCPECGCVMQIYFDVRSFVLRELRERAASIYQDVHLLALHYKWPEETILGLPQTRRRYYAEMLRSQGVA
jgi:hypothetical protein